MPKKPRHQLALVLILALLLRLGHVLIADPWPKIEGGDYAWYASVGSTLVTTGWTHGPPQTAPVFLLVAGYAERLNPHPLTYGQAAWLLREGIAGEVLFPEAIGGGRQVVRLLYAILGALTVLMIYRVGRKAWGHTIGLVAALALAVGPAFVIESGNLTTETISLFLLSWVLALWLERIERPDERLMAAMGGLLGLAALTRAVFLGVPLVLLLHLWMKSPDRGANPSGKGLKPLVLPKIRSSAILLLALAITLAPWTLYNLVTWGRFTVAGEGLLGTLYVGAAGWQDPDAVDAALGFEAGPSAASDYDARQTEFARGIAEVILRDLPGYLARRAGELIAALLQPHNTVYYPGESIRALFLDWLRADRTPGGLLALTRADALWPKLLLYVFHYAALLLGGIGLARNLRRWRDLWPLYGLVAYVLAIHLVLAAIPRYLFPIEPVLWLFTAATLVPWVKRLWASRRVARVHDDPMAHG